MISEFVGDKKLILVRNPYYQQWSYAAQPAGFPDRIEFAAAGTPTTQMAHISSGRADLLSGGTLTSDMLRRVAHRTPELVHTDFGANTEYEFLNTRTPPFNDVKVRQALNLAVDRDKILTFYGDASGATLTCQVLPPNFPGYRRYCPFTSGGPRPDGSYHGPDTKAAQRLIDASATRGSHIVLASWTVEPDRSVGRYIAALLTGFGYQVRLHESPVNGYFAYIEDPRNQVQIGSAGWSSDYPTPSTFFVPNFACSADPAIDQSRYCNPAADVLAGNALQEEGSDPSSANKTWALLDRTITNDSPWVSTVNLGWKSIVSARVGNYVCSPQIGPLLDQLWVQ
jgi:peptide/nickel transport system substrate-binding protein